MTGQPEGQNPWWDPMGVWQQVGEPFAYLGVPLAADQGTPAWGARNALQLLVDGLRKGLVGRPVAFGAGPSRVAFTLSSLEASVGHLAAAAGQADDVSLAAENVEWRSYQFASMNARLHNVHTRFRHRPVLVAAPVDVSLVLTEEVVSALMRKHVPAVTSEIAESGRMFLRHARWPKWGYLEVRPAIEHGGLVVRPTGVGRGARVWRFGRRIAPVRPRVALPDGLRIVGVDVHPRGVEVHLRADEWRLDYRDLASLGQRTSRPAR